MTDFSVKHTHQIVNFVDLTVQLMSVIVSLRIRLIEFKVGFLHLCDSQGCLDQIPLQFLLNSDSRLIDQRDVLQLLVIICSSFFLLCIHLHDDPIDLFGKLFPQTIEVKIFPGF